MINLTNILSNCEVSNIPAQIDSHLSMIHLQRILFMLKSFKLFANLINPFSVIQCASPIILCCENVSNTGHFPLDRRDGNASIYTEIHGTISLAPSKLAVLEDVEE